MKRARFCAPMTVSEQKQTVDLLISFAGKAKRHSSEHHEMVNFRGTSYSDASMDVVPWIGIGVERMDLLPWPQPFRHRWPAPRLLP